MLSERGQRAWLLIMAILLLDSMASYFLRNLIGVELPINVVVPLLCALAVFVWGIRPVIPPTLPLFSLLILSLAFLSGIFFIDDFTLVGRGRTLASAMTAFFVGYTVARNTQSADKFARVLLIVGLLYVVVCVVALTKVMPSVFPLINALGYRNGELVIRPEVTIDQNFQIFYLFFLGVLFLLPARPVRIVLILLGAIGAAYVLARLETRSGMLLFIGSMGLAWLAPLRTRGLGRRKILVLPVVLLVFAIVEYQWVLNVAHGIITRFTDSAYDRTIYGRFHAIQFLFEKLIDPNYWVPQGNSEYLQLTGNIPHSNPTAVYLEAGLLGLVGWFMLVVIPLAKLSVWFYKRRLDALETMVMVSGVVVFMAQLSLNTPLYDHVWLWAGAVIGALERARLRHAHAERSSLAPAPAAKPDDSLRPVPAK